MRTAARASLVLLALVLPFESRQPIAHIGPLDLTLVELALYAAIALGGAVIVADVARRGWLLHRDPQRVPRPPRRAPAGEAGLRSRESAWRDAARRHAVAIAWVLALALSAAAADFARADAVKFALRATGGVALYVVAAAMVRQQTGAATALLVAGGIVAGATIAALAMCAEIHVPGAAAALTSFHTHTFQVLGLPRASGPFQYPNIAAMYVEAALPLAIAVGAALDARGHAAGQARAIAGRVAGAAVAVLLAYALSLTASRAALVTTAVVLAGTVAYALWRRAPSRWPAMAALAVLAAAAATTGPLGSLRLQFWKDAVWYRSHIVPVAPFPASVAAGDRTMIDVDVANTGARAWTARGQHRVALSYHWWDPTTARAIVFEGERTPLPRDLPPGDTARVRAVVVAPDGPGRYRLHMQMVHEGITWFDEQGDAGHQVVVHVSRRAASAAAPGPARAPAAPVPPALEGASRTVLWRAAVMAWRDHPVTGLGPDNFRRAYGRYLGLTNPDPRLHANSLYLETLASLGLVGAAALVLTIVWFWRAGRRALRAHGASTPVGLLAVGACGGLAAYLVHGFVDYFLEFTPTYALLWLLGGMLAGLGGDERTDPAQNPQRVPNLPR